MDFNMKRMNEIYAREILLWKYDAPYEFYNNELNDERLQELLNGEYAAVVDESDQLVGFFCAGTSAQVPAGYQYDAYLEEMIDFGLGMRPLLTGKGNGFEFLTFIIRNIQESHGVELPLRLTVATFNKRAISLYEKFGFSECMTFDSNGAKFTIMVKR